MMLLVIRIGLTMKPIIQKFAFFSIFVWLICVNTLGMVGCAATQGSKQNNLERRFRQWDKNGDGVLTQEEVRRPDLFEQADQDGDGQITPAEARAFLGNRQRSQPANQIEGVNEQDQPRLAVNTHFDIRYAQVRGSDPNLTSLDIYAPNEAKNYPVMVYIHGGSWQKGDKRNVGKKPQFFIEAGYLFVSINYRLLPDIEHPTNVQDVAKALAWVHSNIEQYGGNPNNIFLLGHSAGAHLAALAATDEKYLEAAGKPLSILKGVVLLDSGAYDIPFMMQNYNRRSGGLHEQVFGQDSTVWRDASPITHVASGKGIPPFLLIHANRLQTKETQANRLATALRNAGIRADVVAAPQETHQTLNQQLGQPGHEPTKSVYDFLNSLQNVPDIGAASPINWNRSYEGVKVASGQLLRGTETMHLEAHQGKLFAGISFTRELGRGATSSQVIVLEEPDGNWQLERDFGAGTSRVGALRSVTFTTDDQGKPISPVSLLLAGTNRSKLGQDKAKLEVHVRDDATGEWVSRELGSFTRGRQGILRAFGFHRDNKTGVDLVFAGAGPAPMGIFTGVYSVNTPGNIRWSHKPELEFPGRPARRFLKFTECNGKLYAATETAIYERQDGEQPTWRQVYERYLARPEINGRGGGPEPIRGLSPIPNPDGTGEVLIFAWNGTVRRLDPFNNFQETIEIDLVEWLSQKLALEVKFVQAAFNDIPIIDHPDTGTKMGLIGIEVWYEENALQTKLRPHFDGWSRKALYLERRQTGQQITYTLQQIEDPQYPYELLGAVRTFSLSPFAVDNDRAIYAGGFNPHRTPMRNTAWIYRGKFK